MTDFAFNSELASLCQSGKAWPFEEARKIVARAEAMGKNSVILETGYGPSGLPHIGTFGEVARTSMVRHAVRCLTEDRLKTELICFSDDLDALRKVPDNVPNQDKLQAFLEMHLTKVPDPFGTHASFGEHNNARLQSFLDSFGFDYTFLSSSQVYKSGRFDEALLAVVRNYDAIMNIMLPSLREERQKTYSPIMPICPRTGKVLQVPLTETNAEAGTVSYQDPETKEMMTVSVLGGHAKLQWKADWAMRWFALGVDYEMSGKDLIDSVKLATKICRQLGGKAPEGFSYEHFLDDEGRKISKSKGNGLSVEAWLTYATPESLALFMYQKPCQAKRLFFDVIPLQVDDYFSHVAAYPKQEPAKQIENPAWHIHQGQVPEALPGVNFAMLLNLVSAANTKDKAILWGFLKRYDSNLSADKAPVLDKLADYALAYYHDFVAPTKAFRAPNDQEREALMALRDALGKLDHDATAEIIQNEVYAIGKAAEFEPLRAWFSALYQVLLGQDKGPRFGSFVALFGLEETRAMITEALARN